MRKFLFIVMSLALVILPGVALAIGDGGDGGWEVTVPEPATMLLLGSGLLGLAGLRRKLRK